MNLMNFLGPKLKTETLKKHTANPPILKLPNFDQEFVFKTDAPNEGIGAICYKRN